MCCHYLGHWLKKGVFYPVAASKLPISDDWTYRRDAQDWTEADGDANIPRCALYSSFQRGRLVSSRPKGLGSSRSLTTLQSKELASKLAKRSERAYMAIQG